MDELSKEYLLLFNGITDTIRELERVVQRLKILQLKAEELSLHGDEGAELRDGLNAAVSEMLVIEHKLGDQ